MDHLQSDNWPQSQTRSEPAPNACSSHFPWAVGRELDLDADHRPRVTEWRAQELRRNLGGRVFICPEK